MHYTLLAYATSFIILFTNFYIHAYIKGKRQGGKGRARDTGHSSKKPVSNGTVNSLVQNGGISHLEEKKNN